MNQKRKKKKEELVQSIAADQADILPYVLNLTNTMN
jgi:hypothetical protein